MLNRFNISERRHRRIVLTISAILCAVSISMGQVTNRLTGAQNWNTAATWIQSRTGTASFSAGSPTVSGTGTAFLTELQAGDVLMLQGTPGTVRGTILSITDNTTLTLTGNAGATASGAYGRQAVPTASDNVTIGNTSAVAAVTISLDVASATVNSLTFTGMTVANTLTHTGTNSLTVNNDVTINQPTANGVANAWNINGGTGTVTGTTTIGGTNNTASRIARIAVTTGQVNLDGTTTLTTGTSSAVAVVTVSTGTVNFNSPLAHTEGTISFTGTGTVNFNSTYDFGPAASVAPILTTVAGANLRFSGDLTTATILTLNATSNSTILASMNATPTANLALGHVIINTGSTLTTVSAAGTFTIAGDLTLNGTGALDGTETVLLTGIRNIDGTGSIGAATTVSALHTVLATADLTITGTMTLSGAANRINNNGTVSIVDIAGTAGGSAWTNLANSTLRVSGTLLTIGTLTATAAPNTVEYYGAGTQAVKGATYDKLVISNGIGQIAGVTVTVNDTTLVNSELNFSNVTGTKTFIGPVIVDSVWSNTANEAVVFRGGLTNNGTFTAGTGIYTFNTNSQQISSVTPMTFDGAVAITGAITVTNTTDVTIAGNLTGSVAGSTWFNAANSTLNVAGAVLVTGTLTATADPNVVNYNGTAAVNQIVKGTTYHHLTVTRGASNVALINAATTVNGTLTVATGTLDLRGADVTVLGTTDVSGILTFTTSAVGVKTFVDTVSINAGGDWTNVINEGLTFRGGLTHNGTTFTSGNGVYLFEVNNQAIGGSSAITITNLTVDGITLTNTGTLTAVTSLLGTGEFANGTNATLTVGATAANLTVAVLNASAPGNIVDYSSAGAQTIRAANYDTLIVSGARTTNNVAFASGGTIGIAATFTPSATFTTGGYVVTNNTIDFNGTSTQTIPAFVFNNLTLSNTGTKTAGGAVIVNADFNNSTLTSMDTFLLTIAGTRTNSGTMQFAGETNGLSFDGGIVEYNGTLAQAPAGQTIGLGLYNNLLISNDAIKRVTGGFVRTQSGLTISSGLTLEVASDGDLQVDGDLVNQGTLTNDGVITVGI